MILYEEQLVPTRHFCDELEFKPHMKTVKIEPHVHKVMTLHYIEMHFNDISRVTTV